MKLVNRQRLLIFLPPLLLLLGFLGLWLRADLEARKWDRQAEELRRRALNDPRAFQGARTTILQGLQNGRVDAAFSGTGRGPLRARLTNQTARPLGVLFQAGQAFLSRERDAQLLIMREKMVLLAPREKREVEIPALAGTIFNEEGQHDFLVAKRRDARLAPLWHALEQRGDLADREIAQAALLLLRENLPLSAVARFDLLGAERPAVADRAGFFYTPRQLISAVSLLREAGYETGKLAVLVDPQFKLETLLDPRSRALAQEFYGLTSKSEWAFWHDALLEGNELLRPRALLGIGRYYPEVALRMLPRWARFENVSFRYRQAALRGLAEMGTPESGALLKKLRWEFREGHPLETSALEALAMHEQFRENPLVPDHLKYDPGKKEVKRLAEAPPAVVRRAVEAPRKTGSKGAAGDDVATARIVAPRSSPFAAARDTPRLAETAPAGYAVEGGVDEGHDVAPAELDLVAMAENLAGQASPPAPPALGGGHGPSNEPQSLPDPVDGPGPGPEPVPAREAAPVEDGSVSAKGPAAAVADDASTLDFAGMAEALAAGEPVHLEDAPPAEIDPEAKTPPAGLDEGEDEWHELPAPESQTSGGKEQSPPDPEEKMPPEEEILRLLGLKNDDFERAFGPVTADSAGDGWHRITRGLPAVLLPDYAGSADQFWMPLWFRLTQVVPAERPATAAILVGPGLWMEG
jgi:hypothetical protein